MKIFIYAACFFVSSVCSQTFDHPSESIDKYESIYGSDSEAIKANLKKDGIVHVIIELKNDDNVSLVASDIASESQLMVRKKKIKEVQSNILGRVFGGFTQASQSNGFDRGLRQFDIIPMMAITLDGTELERFANDPDVLHIHSDALGQPELQNSVPLIGMTGGGGAYLLGATGQGQAVAVLDTGVQASHPFLTGKTIAEACFSNATGTNGMSLCPNGQKTQTGLGSADVTTPNCIRGQRNLCSHGTHVSGIAVGNNPIPGIPPNGVAKDAKLIAVQVFTRFDTLCGSEGPCLLSWTSDQLAALEWIYLNKNKFSDGINIASINMSIGGKSMGWFPSEVSCNNSPLKPLIDLLRSSGIATTISSGDNGYVRAVTTPGCITTAITVGAATSSVQTAWFSNDNQILVDLLAPGVNILSSVPVNQYENYNGTSMAAPHVAGAFAAIKSRLPNATVDQIETALKNTGVPIFDHKKEYTTPMIQVNSALNELGVASWVLNVAKTGNGTITSAPAGIECGATCSASFASGASVTLSQSAADGYSFSGWGGACTGTGPCSLIMDAFKNVTATFIPPRDLSVTRTGNGTITSIPTGITCGSTCSGSFPDKSNVSLIAKPDYGYDFTGWTGACAGTGTCSVAMDGVKSVSATFSERTKHPVKITKPNTGVISSEPAGILCGGTNKQCVSLFSSAKLTATPNPGYEFIRWSGCQVPEGNICNIKPTGKMTLSAVFKKLSKYNIKIIKNNLGSITSLPAGLYCPDKKKTCTVKFTKGTEVVLTPVPQQGRSFAGWTGACSGIDICTILIDGNKGVGAAFQ